MKLERNHANLILAAILLVFVFNCRTVFSEAVAGGLHDEMLYFEGAKSLAESGTYRIPNLPGEPAQTKYPILFSILLSVVWLVEPSFPENLIWAQSLMVLLGVLFLLATYHFARSVECPRAAAVAITAICSIHASTISFSTVLLTDILFSGLMLTTMTCADRYLQNAVDQRHKRRLMVRLLLSVAAMILLRTLGVAAALGIAACGLWRRNYRFAIAVTGVAVVTEASWVWWAGTHLADWAQAEGSSEIFLRTLSYYSSYVQFWLASTPDWQTLVSMINMNARLTIIQPGAMCLQLPLGLNFTPLSSLAACFSLLVFVGIFRGAARNPRAVHFVLPFYWSIVLLWNFPIPARLLFPFLPCFAWGLGNEVRRFAGVLIEAWRDRTRPIQRPIAFTIALIAVIGGVIVSYRYWWAIPAETSAQFESRIIASKQKVEVYSWIKRRTDLDDRFVTYGDGLLYLHTGRQAILPAVPLTTWIYKGDLELLRRSYRDVETVATAINARYWVTSADDAGMIADVAADQIARVLAETLVVFQSSDGTVQVHDLSSWYTQGK